jgi:hypothetical protein
MCVVRIQKKKMWRVLFLLPDEIILLHLYRDVIDADFVDLGTEWCLRLTRKMVIEHESMLVYFWSSVNHCGIQVQEGIDD